MNMTHYTDLLQSTMQNAIAVAERLREEGRADIEAAVDLQAQVRELRRKCELDADAAAQDRAAAWIEGLHQRAFGNPLS